MDRICRLGGGFRMGPFELMDLVGIDVGFEVAQVVHRAVVRRAALEAEPAAGADGGRRAARPQDRARLVRVRRRAAPAARTRPPPEGDPASSTRGLRRPGSRTASSARSRPRRPAARRYHLLPGAGLVELTRAPPAPTATAEAAERLAHAAGLHHEWVGDAPGLVLGRIVCLPGERGGLRGRRGRRLARRRGRRARARPQPPARAGRAGARRSACARVLATIDGLWAERHEERYRAAPLLRRAVALGVSLDQAAPTAVNAWPSARADVGARGLGQRVLRAVDLQRSAPSATVAAAAAWASFSWRPSRCPRCRRRRRRSAWSARRTPPRGRRACRGRDVVAHALELLRQPLERCGQLGIALGVGALDRLAQVLAYVEQLIVERLVVVYVLVLVALAAAAAERAARTSVSRRAERRTRRAP